MRQIIQKSLFIVVLGLVFGSFTGCTQLTSSIKDLQAETLGLARDFYVYDDYGNQTMVVSGKSTDIQSSEVENVLLITIDGKVWQHVGSSMIIVEKGIKNMVDTYAFDTTVASKTSGTFTFLDRKINNFKSNFTGLKRVIVVKNQSGVIIGVYEGDNVLVEASSLPQSTKILIDNMRMTIYRCDFEIFEQALLN